MAMISTRLAMCGSAAALLALSGGAWAQNGLGPAPVPVDAGQGGRVSLTRPVLPPQAGSVDYGRVFVDTGVSDVRVNETYTVATMNRSPQSVCASNQYVFERDRPKWLMASGRLLQAMKEGATVRISFTCRNGMQSVNAVQFLSPPPPTRFSRATPRRAQSVEAFAARQTPVYQGAGQVSATGGMRGVPLP